jgi:hypothetical protein
MAPRTVSPCMRWLPHRRRCGCGSMGCAKQALRRRAYMRATGPPPDPETSSSAPDATARGLAACRSSSCTARSPAPGAWMVNASKCRSGSAAPSVRGRAAQGRWGRGREGQVAPPRGHAHAPSPAARATTLCRGTQRAARIGAVPAPPETHPALRSTLLAQSSPSPSLLVICPRPAPGPGDFRLRELPVNPLSAAQGLRGRAGSAVAAVERAGRCVGVFSVKRNNQESRAATDPVWGGGLEASAVGH